jgi:hypothetical protein
MKMFHFLILFNLLLIKRSVSSFGGLEDARWPLGPKFAGSNPAEAKNSLARLPSEAKKSRRSHVVDLRHVKDP